METRTIGIDGMHCGACVRRVTTTLNKVPGTLVEKVEIGMARVRTTADGDVLVAALGKAGYPARLA